MDRQEIERVYAHEAFAEDRNQNARTEAEVQHGLLVSPNEMRRMARHAGEVADPPGTVFVAPYPEESYDAFAERVLALLSALDLPQTDEMTLQGLRQ
jgi:hypothetical protein